YFGRVSLDMLSRTVDRRWRRTPRRGVISVVLTSSVSEVWAVTRSPVKSTHFHREYSADGVNSILVQPSWSAGSETIVLGSNSTFSVHAWLLIHSAVSSDQNCVFVSCAAAGEDSITSAKPAVMQIERRRVTTEAAAPWNRRCRSF